MKGLKKILNVTQTRQADNYTIDVKFISSLALMETAALSFVEAFIKRDIKDKKIAIFCGIGNNGGDGFAVCRLLRERGVLATAILVKFKDKLSRDCKSNLDRLGDVVVINSMDNLPNLSQFDMIIDAILGLGLNAPVKGFVAKVIETINNLNKPIYSIDVPSGLFGDSISSSKNIVKSDFVISFQRPKLSFFFPESGTYVKNWKVVDIGLDEAFIQQQDSDIFILDEEVRRFLKQRKKHSHKGTYGHAFLIAGSYGKIGAAILAAKASLRSGVGLLTTFVPKCGYEILQTSIPESMCLTDKNHLILTKLPDTEKYNAIGIGPGIGKDKLTVKLFENLLKNSMQPLVLDADAINIISLHKRLINYLPIHTILTPHIKEFDRLVGESRNTVERLEKQKEFSKKHRCIIVLKDAYTCISSITGELFFNTSGNQGMATAGSGDVLTGIITGLLAQKYEPLYAAILAVYFHGKAADKALDNKCYHSLIASDIIENFNIK